MARGMMGCLAAGVLLCTACQGQRPEASGKEQQQMTVAAPVQEMPRSSRAPRQIDYENPTHEDIIALVKRARDYYARNGRHRSLDDFMDSGSPFVAGRTYIFVYDYAGNCLAEWAEPGLVGRNMQSLSDAHKQSFLLNARSKAEQGGGWVATTWRDPLNNSSRGKDCYVLNVDGKYLIGSGVYR